MRIYLFAIMSFILWVIIVITLFAFFVPAAIIWLLTLPFDRRLVIFHQLTSLWAAFYLFIVPVWSVRILGRENHRKDQVYVMVSNHRSMVDILALFCLFVHFKWVSKKENFRLPVVGWVMWMNRYISVKRSSRTSIRQMMEDSRVKLRRGNSVLIFPEGTRSGNRGLGPFRDGAFRLAHEEQLPVLPVLVTGTNNAVSHNLIFTGPARMKIRILKEIHPADFSSADDLREHIRSIYVNEMEKEDL